MAAAAAPAPTTTEVTPAPAVAATSSSLATAAPAPAPAAQEQLATLVNTIGEFGTAAHLTLKQGKALEAVAAAAIAASQYVEAFSSDVDLPFPIDRASPLLSAALTSLASVLERAQTFDTEHSISVSLYGRLEALVQSASATIAATRTRLAGKGSATAVADGDAGSGAGAGATTDKSTIAVASSAAEGKKTDDEPAGTAAALMAARGAWLLWRSRRHPVIGARAV